MIPFNKPYFTGKETELIEEVFRGGQLAGNGAFTAKCHRFFQERFGFEHCFLTNSATSALEMAAILCCIEPGDEVILPSYTFVASATPFALLGAKLVFCDSENTSPNMDAQHVKSLISPKTKVIVVMHYAGLACDLEAIMALANEHGILVIEDAAHGITSTYKEKNLGSFGHLAAFSFHETKNISSGQGGMLVVNDTSLLERAEKVWTKGTNRLNMERGEVDKYEWVDLGSNFYPSEITAALLFAQLSEMEYIQAARKKVWEAYHEGLKLLEEQGRLRLPEVRAYQSNNYHIFYLICGSSAEREGLIQHLNGNGVLAVSHYEPLHRSPYIRKTVGEQAQLVNADMYAERLLRLPLFVDLDHSDVHRIVDLTRQFYSI